MNIPFRITAVFFMPVFFLSQCITADKDSQSLNITSKTFRSDYDEKNHIHLKTGEFTLAGELVTLCRPNLTDDFLNWLIVDTQQAAIYNFCNNYKAIRINVTNNTDHPIKLNIESFPLKINDTMYVPVNPNDLPRFYTKFNPKGIVKNAYNVAVITLVAAVIVIALTDNHNNNVPAKMNIGPDIINGFIDIQNETNRQYYNNYNNVYNYKSSTAEKREYFSNIFHRVDISYSDLFLHEIELKPEDPVFGVIFYREGLPVTGHSTKLLHVQ